MHKRPLDGSFFYSPLQVSLDDFIADRDEIVVSPGFDLSSLSSGFSKRFFVSLIFLLKSFTKKRLQLPEVLEKTTVTKLLTLLINHLRFIDDHSLRALEGGNVGRGMLDLISRRYLIMPFLSFQVFSLSVVNILLQILESY